MPDYTTREMMEAYDQTPPVRSFFQKTFFPGNQTHVSEKVEFDVRKGKRIMAPFVSPRKGGKVITRQGFRTNEFTTPKLAPERALTIDDVNKRGIGENIYSKKTPEEREDERRELLPNVEVFKEIMVELIKNQKIDIEVLFKERSEYIQDMPGEFQLNEMLLHLVEEYPEFRDVRRVETYRIEDGGTVTFEGILDQDKAAKTIRCSNVLIRVGKE